MISNMHCQIMLANEVAEHQFSILATPFSTVCWVSRLPSPSRVGWFCIHSTIFLCRRVWEWCCKSFFPPEKTRSSMLHSLQSANSAPCLLGFNQLFGLGSLSPSQCFVQRTHYLLGHFLGEVSARSSSESLDSLFTWLERDTRQWMSNMLVSGYPYISAIH